MERRWRKRRKIKIGITVFKNNVKIDTGTSCDISSGGMAIQLDNPVFIKNTIFDVHFCGDINGEAINHRVPVLVVYSSNNKLGVMFNSHDSSIIRKCNDLINDVTSETGEKISMMK